MKDNTVLLLITILFLVTGGLLLFSYFGDNENRDEGICLVDGLEYSQGDVIRNYLEASDCVCGSDGLIECIPVEDDEAGEDLDSAQVMELDSEDLEFDYAYVMGIPEGEPLSSFPLVAFQSINKSEGKLNIVLEQLQLCSDVNIPSQQAGFYKQDDSSLFLYNMVRPLQGEETVIDCIVEVKYVLDGMSDLVLEEMEIAFVDELGEKTFPTICLYNNNVYSNGDVFQGLDGDVCICNDGSIECNELTD